MRPSEVPILEGWCTFSEAAEALGISKQGIHKKVFGENAFKTVRAVGSKPLYLLWREEVEELVEKRRKSAQLKEQS